MDYRQKAKDMLSDYVDLKVCIDNILCELENDDEELEPCLSAIKYKESVKTSAISAPTEREALKRGGERKRLERDLKVNQATVARIDRCLQALREGQRRIVMCRHVRCMSWEETSVDTGYSVSQCKRVYKKAIYRVSIGLYGERARRTCGEEEQS